MNHSAWIDPRINRVTVGNVQTYLLNKGWRLQEFPGPELLVFEGPKDDDGEPIIQVLPSSEQFKDHQMRVADLIDALGVMEDRSSVDILADILAAPTTNGSLQQHSHGVNCETV